MILQSPKQRRTLFSLRILKGLATILFLSILSGCSLLEDSEPAPDHEIDKQEDVLFNHGFTVRNLSRLDEFIERQSGSQRVVQYTVEGAPIFEDLQFEQDKLKVVYDTTEDDFGPREITTIACSQLERTEKDTLLKYTLNGCEGEAPERLLLQVDFDLEEEDDFAFVLKYGVNRKNEMNTRDGKLIKDLQNGSLIEVSDFMISQKDKQLIYREMVLANYLADKELSEECNMKPYVSYELETTINAQARNYTWSECDTSSDGKEMSSLAQFIIDLVKSTKTYQSLPEVQGYYQ